MRRNKKWMQEAREKCVRPRSYGLEEIARADHGDDQSGGAHGHLSRRIARQQAEGDTERCSNRSPSRSRAIGDCIGAVEQSAPCACP